MNVVRLTGIILLAGGTVGAGLTYRSMRTENLLHARTGEVPVPFADSAAAATATFQPYTDGVYHLYLAPSPSDAPPCPSGEVQADLARFDGILDVTINDRRGRVVVSRSVGPGDFPGLTADRAGWYTLDSVAVIAVQDSAWSIEAAWCPGTAQRPACTWAVFLLPPQAEEIGGFLARGITRLLLFAGAMVLGFILIVAGGTRRE